MTTRHSTNIGVGNTNDALYTVDITLGGQNFTVLLDTGSSDLWISPQGRHITLTNTSDLVASEVYGQGSAQGNIAFAELKVGPYVVPSQAFVNATELTGLDAQIASGIDGYLGMSFDVSSIFGTIQQSWGNQSASTLGRSFITNLFAQNESLPNSFDLQLGRIDTMDAAGTGTFTISEHSSEFGDVTDAPKLPRVAAGRWSVVMDEMRINGERFSFNKSSVPGVPEGKVAALLDSGFSLPPLPPAAVDAIYTSIPGSVFYRTQGAYLVPCNSSTMLSFVFGGQEFAVHPLDLALPIPVPILKNGVETNVTVCLATYQYLNLDPTGFNGFDLILGDAFLRNVYASFDYGDFNPMTKTDGIPFVQLLTTVDYHTAMDEFYEDRTAVLATLPPVIDPSQFIQFPLSPSVTGGNTSTTGSTNGADEAAVRGALSTDGSGDGSSDSDSDRKTFRITAIALLGANLLVGLVLLAFVATMCVRGVKGSAARNVGSRYVPVRFKEAEAEHDPEHGAPRYTD
ncbi:aspartic peptidase domain-containing protein [Trametes maxima]|nr:aspartic peptidase domain-containing protein [Trametes maxima]